jgi:prophage antirepressor-like protein
VRVVQVEGEPWFVVGDVCDALGLEPDATNKPYQNHYRRLSDDELATASVPSGLRTKRMKIVAESGLYKLVMRSDKPNAKAGMALTSRIRRRLRLVR